MRRLFDLVAAAFLLVATAPLLAAGALLVLLTDGRPIFFAHRRLGLDGRPFSCWKLRTMKVGAEQTLEGQPDLLHRFRANGFKLPVSADPRVTRVGRWLRRAYIDEIPQLVNVLRGEMSIIGPRPIVEDELPLFGPSATELHRVRPGIFGAWNSLGRSRPPYPERASLELRYVRERSLAWDLRILARSVHAVLQGESDSGGAGPHPPEWRE